MGNETELGTIVEAIRARLERKNEVRDAALKRSRKVIRQCSLAIRAVHRGERDRVAAELAAARGLVGELRESLHPYPDLYHAGYTQDALKEFAEANLVRGLIADEQLPSPDDLEIEDAAYLGGLGEAAGELRRQSLDALRMEEYEKAELLLAAMDEIYGLLVTIDFPDAITGGLRRTTDMVRGVTERTRGDLTTSLQQYQLRQALEKAERGGTSG
jgi:translin